MDLQISNIDWIDPREILKNSEYINNIDENFIKVGKVLIKQVILLHYQNFSLAMKSIPCYKKIMKPF